VIGEKEIVTHYEARRFIKELKNRGFKVHEIDISEFIKFGGGLKCLTF
jgi:N-dimethylarginine dimethylaminohydrolase